MRIFNERNYNLLRELVATDFKLRYQGSILGYLWSLAKPMMLFGVLYLFAKFLRFGEGIPYFPVMLLLGIVLWSYFVEATSQGLGSVVGRGDLLRKISFPKYIIVFSTSVSAFVNLLLNLVVVGVFMAFSGVPIYPHIIVLPFLLIELMLLATGVSFLLSALFVKYRDISHIWEVVLQVMFYATPIIYPVQILSPHLQKIIMLNPLAQIIQDARYYTIYPQGVVRSETLLPHGIGYLLPVVVIIIVLLGGLYFRANSKNFAEEI